MHVLSKISAAMVVLLALPVYAATQLPAPDYTRPLHHKYQYHTKYVQLPKPLSTERQKRIDEYHSYYATGDRTRGSSYDHPYLPQMLLPSPQQYKLPAKRLTLKEAIMLALRTNPDVINSEIQRIVDKWRVIVARYEFRPHYTLGASGQFANKAVPNYNFAPSMSIKSPIGTEFKLAYDTPFNGSYGYETFSIRQPLIRGFGYVNRINYENALDAEMVARLGFKLNIMNVVVGVITQYRVLVGQYNALSVQKNNLRSQYATLRQYKSRVAAGQLARSALVQQEANVAQAENSVEQNKINLQNVYQSFLTAIGLVPDAKIIIDPVIHMRNYKIPNVHKAIKFALAHNVEYRQTLIGLHADERAIVQAEDARKVQLDVVGTASLANSTILNSFQGIVPTAKGPGVEFILNIPINDIPGKAAEVAAEVALEKAKNNLEKAKENLIRTVMKEVATIKSQQRQIKLTENLVRIQKINLRNKKLSQRFGKATALDVTTVQNALLSAQIGLLGVKITYLQDVTQLYQTLGLTLDKWHVVLRY